MRRTQGLRPWLALLSGAMALWLAANLAAAQSADASPQCPQNVKGQEGGEDKDQKEQEKENDKEKEKGTATQHTKHHSGPRGMNKPP